MNWLRGSNTLIWVSISLFVFSCKVGDGDISSSVQPKTEVLSTFFQDSFKLHTTVMLYDSVITNNSERMLVGVFSDPVFGKVTAKTFTQFSVENFKSFGPNPKLVSTSLIISFTTTGTTIDQIPFKRPYFYGSPSSTEKVYFYKLDESIDRSKKYISNDKISFSQYLGSSVITTTSDITLPLDSALGHDFIFTEGAFETPDSFNQLFKGIAIVPDENNTAIWGIMSARIELKYQNYYGFNNLLVQNTLNIYSSSLSGSRFFNLSSDRSGSKTASLVQNYDSLSMNITDNACYFQSNSGIGTAIRFPFIENFKKSVKGKILIDRAEIIIKPKIDVDSASQPPPPFIVLHELSSDGKIKKVSDNEVYLQSELNGIFGVNSPLLIEYNIQTGSYRIPLTTYLQALIDGNKPNYGLLLKGTNEYREVRNNGSGAILGSGFFGVVNKGVFFNDKSNPFNITLRVYYTPYE